MTQPLTADGLKQYVAHCASIRQTTQSYRDAFDSALEAARALEEPDCDGIVPPKHEQRAVKFWQIILWLGVYRHLDLSLAAFIANYKPTGSSLRHRSTIHIKRIVEA